MKKYIGFLIVLSLFILGGSKAQAAINPSTPCDINASPSITVLSPNGGETYLVGQQIEVKWRSCNIPSSAMITPVFSYVDENDVGEIHNGGAQSLNHVLNSGSAWITPPTSFLGTLGKHFKIKLVYNSSYATDPNSIQVLDYSDDTFTITKFENANKFPDGCNSAMGFSSTTGLPCFLDTYSATSITKNGAVLNGRLIANAPAEVYFTYNKTGNGNKVQRTPKITQQSNGLFSYTLSSLSPNTSYDYKACMYYVGAERCARQLTFKTFPASYIQEEDGCKNSEIYSSTTGQRCSTPIELEQKCDPATDCYEKEIPVETKIECDSAAGCYKAGTTRVLRIGVKGEDVKYIQTLLGITADGSYGPVTAQKVKEWQAKNMLKVDGIFGPQSMSIISQ